MGNPHLIMGKPHFIYYGHNPYLAMRKLHLIMGSMLCGLILYFALVWVILYLLAPADYVCGGELFTHLHQIGPFTEDQTKIYAAEVTLALEHLHNVSEGCGL